MHFTNYSEDISLLSDIANIQSVQMLMLIKIVTSVRISLKNILSKIFRLTPIIPKYSDPKISGREPFGRPQISELKADRLRQRRLHQGRTLHRLRR